MISSCRSRLALFAALYVVQGIGLAYFRHFQKLYLDSIGISPDAIGILTFVLQILFIPKILIGSVSDRVDLFGMDHRKPFVLYPAFAKEMPLIFEST